MFIYGIIIRLYYLAIFGASPFNAKAKKWMVGRRRWRKQLGTIDFLKHKWVWFHCSSFGEFQDGKSLMETFAKQHPDIKILLTFFSSTGFELQKDYTGASAICYLPLDTAGNAAFFLDTVKPMAAFFIRHDIWPNFVRACADRNIPDCLVSFTLNTESGFLKFPLKNFYRSIFQCYTCIFVQYPEDENILRQNVFSSNIIVSGNSRIDRIVEAGKENRQLSVMDEFVKDSFCVIAGSTHARDREIILETYGKLKTENIKWIIVPHEIDVLEIERARNVLKDEMAVYSQSKQVDGKAKLLWIDQVGILAHLYRYADIAFIGGGFSKAGIHSILEPALYGCAVCFGPNHRQYKEALDLMNGEGASLVNDTNELAGFILKFKNDNTLLARVKALNSGYILNAPGASKNIMQYLEEQPWFN
jgi:3-deoxy-D-manno-octulosonic-acid transferase